MLQCMRFHSDPCDGAIDVFDKEYGSKYHAADWALGGARCHGFRCPALLVMLAEQLHHLPSMNAKLSYACQAVVCPVVQSICVLLTTMVCLPIILQVRQLRV